MPHYTIKGRSTYCKIEAMAVPAILTNLIGKPSCHSDIKVHYITHHRPFCWVILHNHVLTLIKGISRLNLQQFTAGDTTKGQAFNFDDLIQQVL